MYVCTHVCMYVCMNVRMFVCVYECVLVCLFVRVYVCHCMCIFSCEYVCTHACMHVDCACVRLACIHVCVCALPRRSCSPEHNATQRSSQEPNPTASDQPLPRTVFPWPVRVQKNKLSDKKKFFLFDLGDKPGSACVPIPTYMHICAHVCACACACVCVCESVCVCLCVCVYAYKSYICVHMCLWMCACACVCASACARARAGVFMHIYVCTYKYIHKCPHSPIDGR